MEGDLFRNWATVARIWENLPVGRRLRARRVAYLARLPAGGSTILKL